MHMHMYTRQCQYPLVEAACVTWLIDCVVLSCLTFIGGKTCIDSWSLGSQFMLSSGGASFWTDEWLLGCPTPRNWRVMSITRLFQSDSQSKRSYLWQKYAEERV